MVAGLLMLLLAVVIVVVPILIGVLAFLRRDTGTADAEEVAELRRRVGELESEADDD